MRQRINELDFLKGVFIILMITFHLVFISDSYPYVKRVVYTFHMPGFLIISGYLLNISKTQREFVRTMLGYVIPYFIMESGYIVMASALPIREHIDILTVRAFFDRLFLHPIGPYWYLHTLICCGITYMVMFHFVPLRTNSRIILLGILFHVFSNMFGVMSFACSLYFLAGVTIRQSGISFMDVFQQSPYAILAFVLLAIYPHNLLMEQCGGVLIVYMVIVGLLFAYSHVGKKIHSLLTFLGMNTMPLFLFSPIFTFLCKPLVPILQFDPTRIIFLFVSLVICVLGSFSVEWVMDRIGISRYFYFK